MLGDLVDEQHVEAGAPPIGADRAADRAGAPDQDRLGHGPSSASRISSTPARQSASMILVGLLVVAAEIAVAEDRADVVRRRGAHEREIRRRLCARRRRRAGEPRPGEVLHPVRVRAGRVDLLDLGPGLRRVPPVVELERQARAPGHELLRQRADRHVAAMAVDDQHAAEAGPVDGGDEIAHDREQRLHLQRDRAREGEEIRREPERHRRKDRHAERLGGFDRDPLGEDGVDGQRQLRVLLGRAERQDAAVVGGRYASTCIQFMSAMRMTARLYVRRFARIASMAINSESISASAASILVGIRRSAPPSARSCPSASDEGCRASSRPPRSRASPRERA